MWWWDAPVIGWICRRSETNRRCQECKGTIHTSEMWLLIAMGNSWFHKICNDRCLFWTKRFNQVWYERLPSASVTRVPISSLSCLRSGPGVWGFLTRLSGFLLSTKTDISKLQCRPAIGRHSLLSKYCEFDIPHQHSNPETKALQ